MIHINATCDKCGEMFKVTVKEKHHPGKVIETYFRCTHCKHKYFSYATDPRTRELQQKVKTEESPFIREAMINEIIERKEVLKERLT